MTNSSNTLAQGLPRGRCSPCGGNLVYRRDHLSTIYRQCLQCGRIHGEWPLPVLHRNQDPTLPYRVQHTTIITDVGSTEPAPHTDGDSSWKLAIDSAFPRAKARRRYLNADEETLAISLLDKALDPRVVAEEFQCTITAIKRLFPRTRTRHRNTHALSDAQLVDMRRHRHAGTSVANLAIYYGVTAHVVRYYTGEPPRSFPQTSIDEAHRLLANGSTPTQVALHFHIPRQYVYRFCRRDHLNSPAAM